MSTISHPRITPEELLKLPDGDQYELVDGELVETYMSGRACLVASQLLRKLSEFVFPSNLGFLFVSGLAYRCFPSHPDRVRHPDLSFIASGRLTEAQFEAGHCPIAPNLAIEVLSPHDLLSNVEAKVIEYLEAGVQLVWVVSPEDRKIFVRRLNGTQTRLSISDQLDGEGVLLGFQCPVGALFENPFERTTG